MSEAREMTLDEWVGRLPEPHRARKELAELRVLAAPAAKPDHAAINLAYDQRHMLSDPRHDEWRDETCTMLLDLAQQLRAKDEEIAALKRELSQYGEAKAARVTP